jgi:aspartate-semialdehyde dehydrogenase
VPSRDAIPVGVLGATGTVGQELVRLLAGHPWFRLAELGASPASAGRPYVEAVRWRLPVPIPEDAAGLVVKDVHGPWESRLLFSALDPDVAGPLEEALARRGHVVVSNAKSHRLDPDVPLLVPEVNPEHLGLLERQRPRWPGAIVTNPNCSAIGLVLALAPLHRTFGVRAVHVVTLQSLSGAGYPGVPALDAADNVLPYIADEEEKLAAEPPKILGEYTRGGIAAAPIAISAQAHRVPVTDGHLLAVSVRLARTASLDEVATTLREFRGRPQELRLPTAPERPLHLLPQPDRPQPRLDRDRERGMAVAIGRLRPCAVLDYRFSALVHNTVRGAAGAALLNAELLCADGRLPTP